MPFDPYAVKLGKKIPVLERRTPLFEKYIKDDILLPYIPISYQWGTGVPRWLMYGNDALGDCTIAAAAHHEDVWSFRESGKETFVSEPDIVTAYSAVSGYVPGNPLTDTGADMLTVMKYWASTGIGGHTLLGFASILPPNVAHIQASIYLFGGCYIGIQLPVTAQAQVGHDSIWTLSPDYHTNPDAVPGSWGGHCVPIIGYSQSHLTLITWGMPMYMSWPWFLTYCDEAYAALSPQWASTVAPNHFDVMQLASDIAGLT